MRVYLDRDVSEELAISTLYDDCIDCEIELSDEEYAEITQVNKAYWDQQDKLYELWKKAMSTQGDKQIKGENDGTKK
uniref:Phage protein n=1 Tax=viral metagenome TaxID=1070528 RepID=A0A6M3LVL4_9ZZZZ